MDWLINNLATILGFILGIGIVAFYLQKLLNIAKELKEALAAGINMFDPAGPGGEKPTQEELLNFWKEIKDIWVAIKDIKKK